MSVYFLETEYHMSLTLFGCINEKKYVLSVFKVNLTYIVSI